MSKYSRYVIKIGKFGAYFQDDKEKKDLTLEDVKDLLNIHEKLHERIKGLLSICQYELRQKHDDKKKEAYEIQSNLLKDLLKEVQR